MLYVFHPRFSRLHDSLNFHRYGGEFNTGTLPYNDRWRQHRRFLQHGFRTEAASSWRPFQLQKAHALLLKVLKDPTQIEDHLATFVNHMSLKNSPLTLFHLLFCRFTASTIMAVTYGYSTLPRDDPLLDLVSRTMAAFVPSTSMANLALFTMFPFCRCSLPHHCFSQPSDFRSETLSILVTWVEFHSQCSRCSKALARFAECSVRIRQEVIGPSPRSYTPPHTKSKFRPVEMD